MISIEKVLFKDFIVNMINNNNNVEDPNRDSLGQKLLETVKIENETMKHGRNGFQRQRLLGKLIFYFILGCNI